MNYLEVAKKALREHQNSEDSLATKATKATKGPVSGEPDPLPPLGDPRRVVFEILDEVWEAGGWLLITGDRVRAAPRDAGAPSDRLTPELLARVDTYQAELLRALTRVPKSVQTERSVLMT